MIFNWRQIYEKNNIHLLNDLPIKWLKNLANCLVALKIIKRFFAIIALVQGFASSTAKFT
jgi:hypothetical protein